MFTWPVRRKGQTRHATVVMVKRRTLKIKSKRRCENDGLIKYILLDLSSIFGLISYLMNKMLAEEDRKRCSQWRQMQTCYSRPHVPSINQRITIYSFTRTNQHWRDTKQEIWANAHETRHSISLISYAGCLGLSPVYFSENSLWCASQPKIEKIT